MSDIREVKQLAEKLLCQTKCTKTDDGFRIEVTGEGAKKFFEKLEKGEVSCSPTCGCC